MLQKIKHDISGIVDLTIANKAGSNSRLMEWGVVVLALLIGLRLLF